VHSLAGLSANRKLAELEPPLPTLYKGQRSTHGFFADELPPSPRKRDFIELATNEFFGIRLNEPATHFVNAPGTYGLVVEYTSFLSEQWARENVRLPDAPFWRRGAGNPSLFALLSATVCQRQGSAAGFSCGHAETAARVSCHVPTRSGVQRRSPLSPGSARVSSIARYACIQSNQAHHSQLTVRC